MCKEFYSGTNLVQEEAERRLLRKSGWRRGGRGRGEPLPHQEKRTAKPTLQTGRRRQSQPCGVRSWREHERGAPFSRRPRVVLQSGGGMESEEGAEPLPRPGGGHQKRASWSSGVKPASSAAFSRRAMSSVSRRQCRHSLAKPYAAGVRTSLSLQTEHLRALMWVSFCVWSIVLLRRCISSSRVKRRRLRRGAMGGGSPTRSAAVVAWLQAFGRNLGKPLRPGDGAVPSASIGEIRTGGEDGPPERRPQKKMSRASRKEGRDTRQGERRRGALPALGIPSLGAFKRSARNVTKAARMSDRSSALGIRNVFQAGGSPGASPSGRAMVYPRPLPSSNCA